ncbi:mechanosensitive ion channel domain-containing protein [Roseivivax isoporae]|uniref:Small mechanosensitive ion channel protein MscS n=1 Tax=Roseivivax isoporae LMG 25204 TaxID=1449351 RepID=X7FC61_9RHOB|nr:mechanosensitive ion channel domain-containing protein [Roseivivax isoporae]ETX30492.1 small mechanosensitive ion channel protein MscS [Roseivivax isoporae LMG 25204]
MFRPLFRAGRAALTALAIALLLLASLVAGPAPLSAQQEAAATEAAEAAAGTPEGTSALQSLLTVLQDDAARAELISQLESVLSGQSGGGEGEGEGEGSGSSEGEGFLASAQEESLGSRVAEFTQSIAETALTEFANFFSAVTGPDSVLRGIGPEEVSVLIDAFTNLFVIIAITVAVFVGLRLALMPVFHRMGSRASEASLLRTVLIYIGSAVLDILVVVIAWAIGYAVTLLVMGDYGQMEFRQALYLNAFLIVELVKVAIRMIVSPAAGGLRLMNVSDHGARRLYRICNAVVSVLGYGQLLIVPIVNRNVSFGAGLGVSALLSLLVLIYLVWAVIRYRAPVADWLARRLASGAFTDETEVERSEDADAETHGAPDGTSGALPATPVPDRKKPTGVLGSFIRLWHWFMLAYLAAMFVVIMTRPADVVFDTLIASGKVALAILLGSVIVGFFGRASRDGLPLPDGITQRLPLLQARVNEVVPKILLILRLLVALAVIIYSVNVIGVFGIADWLASQRGLAFSGAAVSVSLILIVAAGIWLALNAWVDYRLDPDHGKPPTSRETTLLTLFRNAATIALILLTLMFALSELGVNIGPLLASAGVLGLAIGFGAQKMVQDIITGVFIQFENAMNVGDVVTVGGTTGTIEKLTIRSVSLRDLQGVFHIIPFSSVDMVSNYMRDFSFCVTDMGIAYRENVDEAREAMLDAFEELRAGEQGISILEDLEWFGVNALGDSAVVLRARIKTLPGKQWGVGRAYNEILKKIFDARGIEIPFPHQTLYFGEDKSGRTQTLRLRDEGRDEERAEAREREAQDPAEDARRRGAKPTEDAPPDAELGGDVQDET